MKALMKACIIIIGKLAYLLSAQRSRLYSYMNKVMMYVPLIPILNLKLIFVQLALEK